MKPLYILKIGGSVVTIKDKPGIFVRVDLLEKIAQSIKKAQTEKDFDLILIHGAGSAGHQLAKKHNLGSGTNGDSEKFTGSLLACVENQKLNNKIFEIFVSCGIRLFPVHTASTIIQKAKKIDYFDVNIIKEALSNNCMPILYGEMVFDRELEMSVCSGDAIAPFLAKKLKAQKMFFASDIDGIFDKDPHLYSDAELIREVNLGDILNNEKIIIGGSHSVDVTDGLLGKIKNLDLKENGSVESVEIFNGLDENNYLNVLLGKDFPRTVIRIK